MQFWPLAVEEVEDDIEPLTMAPRSRGGRAVVALLSDESPPRSKVKNQAGLACMESPITPNREEKDSDEPSKKYKSQN